MHYIHVQVTQRDGWSYTTSRNYWSNFIHISVATKQLCNAPGGGGGPFSAYCNWSYVCTYLRIQQSNSLCQVYDVRTVRTMYGIRRGWGSNDERVQALLSRRQVVTVGVAVLLHDVLGRLSLGVLEVKVHLQLGQRPHAGLATHGGCYMSRCLPVLQKI